MIVSENLMRSLVLTDQTFYLPTKAFHYGSVGVSYFKQWSTSLNYVNLAFHVVLTSKKVTSLFQVPEIYTRAHTESFRLQSLKPYTEYVVQMRCIEDQHGVTSYWSDWSANATVRTAEARMTCIIPKVI